MSQSEQQQDQSPLLSDRGTTIISDTVVSSLAGMAAREVEGVHMGGVASRTAGGVLGSIRGSESKTSGISVEVGRTETAIDLKIGIEYNKNILQTVEEVRRRITDRIQSMTGLRVKELNATITDITFPEKEERRRIGSRSTTGERDASTDETATAQPMISGSEPHTGASERDTTQVEAASQAESETTPEETEVSAEDRVEDTAEVRSGDPRTEEQPAGETSETSEEAQTRAEIETSEPAETGAEARRRRRAEERARRRRRTEDS